MFVYVSVDNKKAKEGHRALLSWNTTFIIYILLQKLLMTFCCLENTVQSHNQRVKVPVESGLFPPFTRWISVPTAPPRLVCLYSPETAWPFSRLRFHLCLSSCLAKPSVSKFIKSLWPLCLLLSTLYMFEKKGYCRMLLQEEKNLSLTCG